MIIDLDVRTLIFVACMANFLSAALAFYYQKVNYKAIDKTIVANFLIAKIFQSFAYFLFLLRGQASDHLSVNIGNSIFMAGFYFEAVAMYAINRRLFYMPLSIVALASITIFNIIETKYHDPALRVIASSLGIFAIIAVPTITMICAKSNYFKKFVGFFYLCFLVTLLPRIITYSSSNDNIFTPSLAQSMTFISIIALTFFTLSAYLILMRETSDKVFKHMATRDFLTGMLNRHSFLNTAEELFNKSKLTSQSIAILFCDIDYFKKVNDTYGHTFGDKVLQKTAEVLEKHHRKNDLACRYGGEEFLIMLSPAGYEEGMAVAERIMNEIKEIVFEEHPNFKYTASIGINYAIPSSNDTLEQFITNADKALYHAKNTGRNKIVNFTSIRFLPKK